MKRAKVEEEDNASNVIISLVDAEGVSITEDHVHISSLADRDELTGLVGQLKEDQDENEQYVFYVSYKDGDDEDRRMEISKTLGDTVKEAGCDPEKSVKVFCVPIDEFTVRPVGRCTHTLKGHAESILSISFSPDSSQLASAGGDGTVRIWDITTGAPILTLKRHTHWVTIVKWSPCGRHVASGGMDGEVMVWNPRQRQDKSAKRHDGKQLRKKLKNNGRITSMAWQPLFLMDLNETNDHWIAPLLAVGDDRGLLQVWDISSNQIVASHAIHSSSHKKAVTDIVWAGNNTIYTAGRDAKIGRLDMGSKEVLEPISVHKHWVNALAINSGHTIRCGGHHPREPGPNTYNESVTKAKEHYANFMSHATREILGSASDDNLVIVHRLDNLKNPKKLTGHQQPINHLEFSPNGKYLVSGSFDKSVRLWDTENVKLIKIYRGHIGRIYRVSWAPDSRWFVSASQDSTIQLWDSKKLKVQENLPGHADEVFALEWSPDGSLVASGGRDKVVRLWRY